SMVRGIANSKIGFGDLILLLRYFFKLKVSTHPNRELEINVKILNYFNKLSQQNSSLLLEKYINTPITWKNK
ncbi:hypothetical protein NYZ65_16835, partial [Acinetobacter baumannii]|nr:hypothetical protein [Acinetobacter baumannii]